MAAAVFILDKSSRKLKRKVLAIKKYWLRYVQEWSVDMIKGISSRQLSASTAPGQWGMSHLYTRNNRLSKASPVSLTRRAGQWRVE